MYENRSQVFHLPFEWTSFIMFWFFFLFFLFCILWYCSALPLMICFVLFCFVLHFVILHDCLHLVVNSSKSKIFRPKRNQISIFYRTAFSMTYQSHCFKQMTHSTFNLKLEEIFYQDYITILINVLTNVCKKFK